MKKNQLVTALIAAATVALADLLRRLWERYTYRGRVVATKRNLHSVSKRVSKHEWYIPQHVPFNPYADGGPLHETARGALNEIDYEELEDASLNYLMARDSLNAKREANKARRNVALATRREKANKALHRNTGQEAASGEGTTTTNAA